MIDSFRAILIACLAFLLLHGCISDASTIQQNVTNQTTEQIVLDNSSQNSANATMDQTGNSTEEKQGFDFSPLYNEKGKLIVYFFHAPRCPACQSIQPKVEDIGFRYQNWTEWKGFNLDVEKDRQVYFQFYNDFNLSPERSGTPMILVNNTILWGQYEINDSLEQIINGSIKRD